MQYPARKNYFSYSFLFGLFLLAASLPYSKFMMSMAEIILFLSWIGEGGLKEKLRLFVKNRTALALSALFILHGVGLLYTSDLHYGFEDFKKKVPLMLLPLLFSTTAPLSKQMFERVLALFTLSVIVSTFISFCVLLGYGSRQILHPQEASLFISHIRFGLLISMSVFILGYFIQENRSPGLKIFFGALIVWLAAFLIMMESATGLVCTFAALGGLFIRAIFNSRNFKIKIALISVMILGLLAAVKIYTSTASEFELAPTAANLKLPSHTKAGNPYQHDTLNEDVENGNYIWRNVCEPEMSEAWNKRSTINYEGNDLRGNGVKYTLIRFLTSKGLAKDAEGVNALSDKEIRAVEKGIPNVKFVAVFNPTARLQKIIWEIDMYLKGINPSGHSVIQRFEFWKAALGIIRENPVFGVGTGDVKNEFDLQYERTDSPLSKEWRLRSHNQFLAIATAFGITGLLLFLFTLFYPLFKERKLNDYLYLMFFIIAFLSMMPEDTLETQVGVTFFAFFNSFLLFLAPSKENTPPQ